MNTEGAFVAARGVTAAGRSFLSRKLARMKIAAAIAALFFAVAAAPKKPTIQDINDKFVAQVTKTIAGHENEPAEQVFMDVRIPAMKAVPASKFLAIMKKGYAGALGVTCTHCHVETDFSSDDKAPKRAAREMAQMYQTINDQLRAMKNLEDPPDERDITCRTCHRGSVDPRESATP